MADKSIQDNCEEYIFDDVTYKPDCPIPIIEESQPLVVASLIAAAGKRVVIKDRKEVIDKVKKEYGYLFQYKIKKKNDL